MSNGISIIIPAWNADPYIVECLNSFYEQTYFKNNDNYEILIGIDGCNNTRQKILNIRKSLVNTKVYWFSKNVGPYLIRTTLGWKAKNEQLLYFDADDVAKDFLVETIMENYDKNVIRFLSEKVNVIGELEKTYVVTFAQIAIKKSIFKKVGGYSPWKYVADKELLHRIENNNIEITVLDDRVYMTRKKHNKSITSLIHKTDIQKKYRKMRDEMKKEKVKKIQPTLLNNGRVIWK